MGENKAGQPSSHRVHGGRLEYERGIRYSSLLPISRHIALTIATWADIDSGVIPDRFQPAKGTLEAATGLSRGAIVKHLNLLEAEGWIGRETGGGRNIRTKFRLRIPAGAKTGQETTPLTPGNGSSDDLYPEETGHVVPETGHVVNVNGSRRDPKSPPSPSQSPPPAEPPVERSPKGGGGGDQRQDEQPNRSADPSDPAEQFLMNLPAPWTAGRKTARELAPLLLERISEQGWDLDGDLAAELTKNPGGIKNYRSVLPIRIDDLPKKPTAKTRASPPAAALPDWCGDLDCDPTDRYRTTEDAQGYRTTRPCPACHPDHAKDHAA